MQSLQHWIEIIGTRGARILVIAIIAFVLARILKVLTTRLVQIAKSQGRGALMR